MGWGCVYVWFVGYCLVVLGVGVVGNGCGFVLGMLGFFLGIVVGRVVCCWSWVLLGCLIRVGGVFLVNGCSVVLGGLGDLWCVCWIRFWFVLVSVGWVVLGC